MARITIPAENRQIDDPREIQALLAPLGIQHERWDLEPRINPDATADEILAAYAPEIERLKQRGGYLVADLISVDPTTPNLDAMMAKYRSEHTHAEDEVRFVVKGRGLFHLHPADGPVLALEVEAGDLINVPAGIRHWFDLCTDRTIRAIRLFQDPAGWTPNYLDQGVHGDYLPLCWSPQDIPAESASLLQVTR
jgi:1,2-dihydroxy-3-keto-5-methylthiopentene dioxygenase